MKTRITKTDKIVFAIISLLGLGWASLFIMGYYQDPNTTKWNTIGYYHNMGDAIGGISAPIIGLISALLVYITIKQQIRANEIIMVTRKEDNLAIYLKDYMEKIEYKYEVIAKKMSSKARPDSIYGNIKTLIYRLKFLENAKKGKIDSIPFQSTETRVSVISEEIKGIMPEIISFIALLKFCHFFYEFLYDNKKDSMISPEAKKLIEIYISEYRTFVAVNLKPACETVPELKEIDILDTDYPLELNDLRHYAYSVLLYSNKLVGLPIN